MQAAVKKCCSFGEHRYFTEGSDLSPAGCPRIADVPYNGQQSRSGAHRAIFASARRGFLPCRIAKCDKSAITRLWQSERMRDDARGGSRDRRGEVAAPSEDLLADNHAVLRNNTKQSQRGDHGLPICFLHSTSCRSARPTPLHPDVGVCLQPIRHCESRARSLKKRQVATE